MTAHQRDCTEIVVETTPDAAVVSNLGSATWTLFEVADRDLNFSLAGAMGGTSLVGLGIATSVDDQVTVLDGDGSLLMSLGALATIASQNPSNLVIVVWKNDVYETTGGQSILGRVDVATIASEIGLEAETVDSNDAFRDAYERAVAHDGTVVLVCDVDPYTPDVKEMDYSHSYVKHRFRQALTGE